LFNFPAGHVDYNLPIIMGLGATLEVDKFGAKLEY